MQAVFGSEVGGAANHENTNHNGGKAFFISHGIDGVIETLDRAQPADFNVIQGSADRIYYIHRVKDGRNHYLVVNDDGKPRQMLEIELDCGTVGLTAEVWLNGEKVGERVWEPYQLDVAKYLHPGKNTLKIAVTNSDANRRAEANVHRYEQRKRLPGGRAIPFVDDIGPSGLIGPVRAPTLYQDGD